jgi:hypothetical protein
MSENIEPLVKPENAKKVLTVKQREQGRKNLERGRAKLAEKKKIQEADKRKEQLILGLLRLLLRSGENDNLIF